MGYACSVVLKHCAREKRYRFTLQVGSRRIPLMHKWVILVRPVEARLSVVEISTCIEKVQVFLSGCVFAVKPGAFEGMLGA